MPKPSIKFVKNLITNEETIIEVGSARQLTAYLMANHFEIRNATARDVTAYTKSGKVVKSIDLTDKEPSQENVDHEAQAA
jgi:hypothetical protein